MNFLIKKTNQKSKITLFIFIMIVFFNSTLNAFAISNGQAASDLIGQYNDLSGTTVNYTKSGVNNGPNKLGLNASAAFVPVAIDYTNHRMFVCDYVNNRVLVFNLNSSNQLVDKMPDNVLGQTDFNTGTAAITQSGMSNPNGVVYDSSNNRLFVSNQNARRVTVYDVASITNGENAINVLGQANFTSSTSSVTQAGMGNPNGIAFDANNNRLFVVNSNRVTVYDVASITDGENAVNVLGQTTFTGSSSAVTQAGMSSPQGIAFDSNNNRLFVQNAKRVTVYDVASITDGENAINVLGQTTFTGNTGAITQAGMSSPSSVTYDSNNNRLFVSEPFNNRVTVYDVASITDGENAINVLGQTTFTGSSGAVTQAGLNTPVGVFYDTSNNKLFVLQSTSANRISIFDVSSITDGQAASDLIGQYNDLSGTTVNYTKSGVNNGPNELGLNGSTYNIALDSIHHRLFFADSTNHRVLVFNLNSSNQLVDKMPDNVLGQTSFYTNGSATTQSGMNAPSGLVYDSTNDRLFVSQQGNHRVTVYDVASITDGENAVNVLGQTLFTTGSAAVTQAGMNSPAGLAYDSTNSRLFVGQIGGGRRITVYDVASITDGENAVNVLGQTTFTGSSAAVTQGGVTSPISLEYDATNNRLFVADSTVNRVLIYDVASITDGENAVNVLGQTTFVASSAANSQSKMQTPSGLVYDSTNSRLFVSDTTYHRVLVFDVASITDGENAVNVLGQTLFTTGSAAVTQAGMSSPLGLAYDSTNDRLFVQQSGSNRISVFYLNLDTTAPTITNVSSDKTNGSYTTGEVIDIDVTFSEAVTSTGNVTVTLETGATDRTCTFTVTTSTTGTCNYTVQSGDTTSDLTVNTISGTINDAALNAMSNFVPATNLAANKALVIDTTAPTITNVSSDKTNGSYTTGEVIDIDVTFSEAVTSTGNVTVTLETGATDRTCTFTVTTSTTGTCNYTVQSGDTTSDLTVNTISGTINDAALNAMSNFVPATNLAANKALVIDTTAPTATINQAGGQSDPAVTNPINFTVVFSEAISPGTFISSDITITGTGTATAGTPTTLNNITWTVPVTATAGGTIIALLDANKVTDVAGNNNTAATSTDNTVTYTPDTTAPILTESTPVTTPTTDHTPDYTFNSDEAGDISYGGSCTSATTTATVGDNTITFDTLTDGTYNDCTITVTDASSNASDPLLVTSFDVTTDTTAPILSESTPVTTPTTDHTPEYTFNTDEAGDISYGGSCTSATTTATVGDNTITFDTLTDGTYNDCTITVTDASSNASDPLAVTAFTIIIDPNSWQQVGTAGFSEGQSNHNSLAIDSNNVPYVAYSDTFLSQGVVKKFNGVSWIDVGSPFSPGQVESISLAIDSNNLPYVAFWDSDDSGLGMVKYFDGADWITVGNLGFSPGETQYISLAFDSNNVPFVAYKDSAGDGFLFVKYLDGSDWVSAGSTFERSNTYSTIAFNSENNSLYLAFNDGNNGGVVVKRFNGSNWVNVGAEGFSNVDSTYLSLAFDSNGIPYITYVEAGNDGFPVVMKFDGSDWVDVGTQPFYEDSFSTSYTSLAIDSNDVPYVAFSDSANSTKVSVMKFDGSNWDNVGLPGFTASGSTFINLRIDSKNALYVSYKDEGNSFKASAMVYDTVSPVLTESTPVTTPTTDHTPDYTFNSDEAGDISYGGSCTSATTTATVGDNTITFDTLTDGTYNDCTITVTDASSNASDPLLVTSFDVTTDTTAPILSESTPVTTPTTDHTPEYTFNTDEAGDISYGGSCTSATTTATVGDNTITFDTLTDGTYNDCTITVTDASSNASDPLLVTSFDVTTCRGN